MGLYRPLDDAVRYAHRWEVDLPVPVEEAYARLEELASRAVSAPGVEELNEAVARAFDAGKDVFEDPEVVRAGALRWFAGPDLERALKAKARALLVEHAEEIFAAYGPVFERAASALTAAHGALGSVPLRDPAPSHVVAFERARTADGVISQIWQRWKVFGIEGLTGFRNDGYKVLVIADVPPETWWRARPDRAGALSPWDVVCMGWPLSLATPQSYRLRVDAVQAIREEALAQIEREWWEQRNGGARTTRPARVGVSVSEL